MIKGKHLNEMYAATLARIMAQEGSRSRLGMGALMWISNSERPLQSRELCHALGVEIGSEDLNLENVPDIGTILRCSLGLITESSSTVQLVHSTLKDYLSGNPSLLQSPHSKIAGVCLTYLNFPCVQELSPTNTEAPSKFPLLEYASCYWGKHIRREETASLTPLALSLLVGFEKHISSRLLLLHYHRLMPWWEQGIYRGSYRRGFTGLHGAASLGIARVVAALLAEKEWDVNALDTNGRTALSWAALGGPQAPLEWGARGGHEGVVKLLLEREDIDPNTADTFSERTPLSWAAENGHEGVVKLLLGRKDTNPNTTDTIYDRTPLSWAAESGHEGVVRLLLERGDVNLNIPDSTEKTAIELAVYRGHAGVVQILSKPDLSLLVPGDVGEVPEHPSPMPSRLPQHSSQPIQSTGLLPTRPLWGIEISSLMIIALLIFLHHFTTSL